VQKKKKRTTEGFYLFSFLGGGELSWLKGLRERGGI
jgi:hypothetical protein